jgi:hypothetical protein
MSGIARKFKELIRGKEVTETYTNYQVSAIELITSDVLEETKQRLVLKYQQGNYESGKDYVMDYANTGTAQFYQYYLAGRYDYQDQFPTVSLGGAGVPTIQVAELLASIERNPVTILSYDYSIVPGYEELNLNLANVNLWIRAELSRLYNYNVNSQSLNINGTTYRYTDNNFTNVIQNGVVVGHDVTLTPNRVVRVNTWYQDRPIYKVTYAVPSMAITKLWYYDPDPSNPNNIPKTSYSLPNGTLIDDGGGEAIELTELEVYPVVMIRQDGWNVVDYDKSTNPHPMSPAKAKPPTLTGVAGQLRFKETELTLDSIGVGLEILTEGIMEAPTATINNLKDTFLLIGITPYYNETVPTTNEAYRKRAGIVSKCLYKLFESVYKLKPNTKLDYWHKYSMSYEESAFNMYTEWIPRPTQRVSGTIFPGAIIGDYNHSYARIELNDLRDIAQRVSIYRWYNGGTSGYIHIQGYIEEEKMWVSLEESNLIINYIKNYNPVVNGTTYHFSESQIKSKFSQDVGDWPTSAGANTFYLSIFNVEGVPPSEDNYYRLSLYYQDEPNSYRIMNIDDLFVQTYVTSSTGSKVNQYVNDANLVIPLPIKLVEELTMLERTDLLSHSIWLNFYAQQTQTITYYKGGIFQSLLQILGIILVVVVSIIAPGAGGALLGSLGAGITGIGISGVISSLFANFLMGMALSIALKFIIKVAGKGTLGKILTAVFMIGMMWASGNFSGALDNFTSVIKTAVSLADVPFKIIEMSVAEGLEEVQGEFASLEALSREFSDIYETRADEFKQRLDEINEYGVTTDYLVGLQRMGRMNSDATGRLLSPSAFYAGSLGESLYNYNILYHNDITDYVDRSRLIGSIG